MCIYISCNEQRKLPTENRKERSYRHLITTPRNKGGRLGFHKELQSRYLTKYFISLKVLYIIIFMGGLEKL